MSIPDLLHAVPATDTGRPFVTYYDEATGERAELSVATTANWVAKTGNMLQDSLGADDGSTVRITLPVHWESCVWLLACWSVGCAVTFEPEVYADIAVVGPDGWDGEHADEVVALSLRPLGARFTEPPPAGVVDFNAEVLGHGDHFAPYAPPADDSPALRRATGDVSHGELIGAARGRFDDHARILLAGDVDSGRQVSGLVSGLVAQGSLVLVRVPPNTEPDPSRVAALVDGEQVTVELP